MCNNDNDNNNSSSALDKHGANGVHFGNGSSTPNANDNNNDHRDCDNNNSANVNVNVNVNVNMNSKQMKRYSAINERPKQSQPQLFKSISLNINGNGRHSSSIYHQHPHAHHAHHNQKQPGFACFCCDPVEPEEATLCADDRRKNWRKWLPPPLRKLSQSKVEKSPNEKALLKKPSEKNLRLPQKHAEELAEHAGSGASGSVGHLPPQFPNVSAQQQQQPDLEAEEEPGLELPPPMKPIQEPHLIANGPPAFPKDLKEGAANLASTGKIEGNPLSEIEQIVRTSREQHESNSRVDGSAAGEACGDGAATDNAATNGRAELGFVQDNNDKNKTDASDSEAGALNRRQLALNELVKTEESYVQDLQKIVNGYMKEIHNKEIPRPTDLQGGKMDLVFNNIKEIYEWHRDKFLRALRHCQKSPADLGPLIESSTKKFTMYYYFCSNKPLSEFIVNAHYQYFDQIRQKLGHRMDLSTLIITPVQRITKYVLLINEILRETKRAGLHNEVASLMAACDQMRDVVKKVNDMMVVLRGLQDFDGEITSQGNLLLQGTLTCAIDAGQKQRELQVFLFQQIIIFADIQKLKTQFSSPIFKFRTHIQLNHMQLERLKESEYSFRIKSTDPNKPIVSIECQASSEKSYDEWLGMLNMILEQQSDLIIRLVNPLNK